jgi:hypothetical protein
MPWLSHEQTICATSRFTSASVKSGVRSPEAWPCPGVHSRPASSGSSPSLADSLRNVSSRGRRFCSARIRSQASSSARVSRKRAKSTTSARLSGGSASQTWIISSVAVLIRMFKRSSTIFQRLYDAAVLAPCTQRQRLRPHAAKRPCRLAHQAGLTTYDLIAFALVCFSPDSFFYSMMF